MFKYVHLIVGVSGDKETKQKKGPTVQSEKERMEILRHIQWVDEIICPCPWQISLEFLDDNDIHYVAHDNEPYSSAGAKDIYYDVKKAYAFRATKRTKGVSTSDMIQRILENNEEMTKRN